MKRILFSVATMAVLFNVVSANAGGLANQQPVRASGCDYREYVHIQGPEGTHIIKLSADVIRIEQSTTVDFQIIGTCDGGHDGQVIAKIGIDDGHYAELTILDGQMMWNPEVRGIRSVGGFNYIGIDHPMGTFQYTLKFARS